MGATQVLGDEGGSGFAGHIGWEFAPLPWLLTGALLSLEARHVGGFVMAELIIPTTWTTRWSLGLGGGVDTDVEDGGAQDLFRFNVALQFLAVALVLHGAVDGGHRRTTGGPDS